MTTELQNKAWSLLPKEFKEEVKRMYRIADSDVDQMIATIMLENVFGLHNLTSDAEGEDDEMLTVPRKQVQQQYKRASLLQDDSDFKWNLVGDQIERVLSGLFGSKCLPDEEPLFSNQPENYNNENLIVVSENKPTESTCTDDCPSPCPSQHFDNIIARDFADHNRLHIAAMLAAGMLASEVRCYPVDRALELADKLIAECEKGDNNA